MRATTLRRVAVSVLFLLAALAVPAGAASAAKATNCGKFDRPETGLQGEVPRVDQLNGRALQGYNCGLALVGHTGIVGAAANMAWAGDCAFVASAGTGVSVIDVRNPAKPRVTATLRGPGSLLALETIAAHKVGDRAVLVAARYGYTTGVPVPTPMDIYDVSDCARPKFKTTFRFPTNVHNLTVSPDGKRVYSTLPIQGVDISDLAHPKYLGSVEADIPQPSFFDTVGVKQAKYVAHEVELSSDGNTMYIGGQTPMYPTFTIVDITDWPRRKPKVLSQVRGRGHSVNVATIKGRKYVLHSEESIVPLTARGCVSMGLNPFAGPAQPWLSDVTDPTKPVMWVSHLTLPINDKKHCARQVLDGQNASAHYHDVDNPDDTRFAMLSMYNAGLRLWDLRDPHRPREAAYFNPGMFLRPSDDVVLDKAWGHVRYDAAKGHIWFATQSGGFWVVELEPQLRASLGLPPLPTKFPNGRAPKPGGIASTVGASLSPAQLYCTVSKI